MQVLLQAFNLLLFRLQTRFHLESSMRQDLFGLLKILNLEFLLEELIFLLLQVLSCILLGLVKILDLLLVIFSLLFQLASDVLNCISLLFELLDLSRDLVLVVLFALDHVFLFANLVDVSFDDLILLLREFSDLMQLVFLLRCQLLLVLHLEVIRNLLAIFVHTLDILETCFELFQKVFNIRIMLIVETLDFNFIVASQLILVLLKLAKLVLFVH